MCPSSHYLQYGFCVIPSLSELCADVPVSITKKTLISYHLCLQAAFVQLFYNPQTQPMVYQGFKLILSILTESQKSAVVWHIIILILGSTVSAYAYAGHHWTLMCLCSASPFRTRLPSIPAHHLESQVISHWIPEQSIQHHPMIILQESSFKFRS